MCVRNHKKTVKGDQLGSLTTYKIVFELWETRKWLTTNVEKLQRDSNKP